MSGHVKMPLARAACAALVLAALAGCGGRDDEEQPQEQAPAAPPPAAPAPSTPAAAPVAVSSVNLGKSVGADKRVASETTQFTPRDTIYASVAHSGTGTGTLTARWTFEDGQVVDESSQTVSGTGVTEFHVSKPSGWPAGRYRVEVSTGAGAPGQSKEFTVQ